MRAQGWGRRIAIFVLMAVASNYVVAVLFFAISLIAAAVAAGLSGLPTVWAVFLFIGVLLAVVASLALVGRLVLPERWFQPLAIGPTERVAPQHDDGAEGPPAPGFPNIVIDIRRLRQDWQDHAGNRISVPRTHRFWWPVIVTNRERERRVSLQFAVSIRVPDGSGRIIARLPTEQDDDLPFAVDPQDSRRIDLSLFINEYLTNQLREAKFIGGRMAFDMNGDLLRLHVFDLLSQQGIEMRLPGSYPEYLVPPNAA